jgi:hypothetical protein
MPDKPISRNIAPNVADSRGDCADAKALVAAPRLRDDLDRNQLVTAIVSNSSTLNWGPVMDKNEDIKTPSATPGTAGNPADPATLPPAGATAAGEPAVESKSELVSIESPTIAPTMFEPTMFNMKPETPGLDAPKIERPVERPVAAEKFEEMKPEHPHQAAPASRDIVPLAAAASGRGSRKFSKFTLLAASVVLAAAFGATAGVLGATGLARLAPLLYGDTATTEAPSTLETTIAQLRSEIAALKAGVDATSRTTSAQYGKLVERFDRVERMQSVASKTDAALPKETSKETTGSITPPNAAAMPIPPVPVPSSTIVPGWAVRDVYRGVAMLQSRVGGMVEVEPGDVLPGLGRIESIRRQDGRWVVFTSKGMITSMR